MKITKTSACVLLVTFLIGIASVPPERTKQIVPEIPLNISPEMPSNVSRRLPAPAATPFYVNGELETVEENNNRDYEEKFKIKLLETGEGFHGDEVAAKNGETWLGLFKQENGKHFLRPAKLKIRRVYDLVVDDEEKYPNRKTGKSVGVNDKARPLFLLKNAGKLPAGEITTLFSGLTDEEINDITDEEVIEYSNEMSLLKNGFFQRYETGGKKYAMRVKEAKTKAGERLLALILEGDGKRQILHTVNVEYADSLGELHWVGDLDRDGKPDFYMELYVQDNAENKNLFLSAPAAKNKLVKKVADFRTTGC